MADEYDFDLITIGGGSGGLASSRRAAALGAKVSESRWCFFENIIHLPLIKTLKRDGN